MVAFLLYPHMVGWGRKEKDEGGAGREKDCALF
jgi:hypothetical protein